MAFITKAKDFSFLVKAKAKDFYAVLNDMLRPRTNIHALYAHLSTSSTV